MTTKFSEEKKAKNNIERLAQHLTNGSLAAELVCAYGDSTESGPREAIAAALRKHVEKVRASIDKSPA